MNRQTWQGLAGASIPRAGSDEGEAAQATVLKSNDSAHRLQGWQNLIHFATCFVVASLHFSIYGWPSTWNYTETTQLGNIYQGEIKTQSSIVLNWRSSDGLSSEQSFYVTVPPNSAMDVEVKCDGNDSILHTEVAPWSKGFQDSAVSLPANEWRKIGTAYSGSSSTDFQVHMYFEKSPWVYGAWVSYANLRLTCRKDNSSPTSSYDLVFPASGGTKTLTASMLGLGSSYITGYITPPSWLSVVLVQDGAGNYSHALRAEQNTATTIRTASVTFNRSNGTSKTITVKQEAAAVTIYEVTFNANGGSGGETIFVAKGKEVGTLPKATKKGYTFKGWYTKKSGGTKLAASTKITKSATYYAQWTANKYKIKFNKNGGNGTMKTQSATYGKTVKLRANAFKKSKCKFAGWAKTKKGKVAYKNKAKVKNLTATNGKTVTLYAVWKKAKASSVKAAATKPAAVPAWVLGTFYGGDEDALSTITVSKAGKVSGKVLFADGSRWTIVGNADGQRLETVVTDAGGNSAEVVFAVVKSPDGRCRIESEDGTIWAE